MSIISAPCVEQFKVRMPLDQETVKLTLILGLCDSWKKRPACIKLKPNEERRESSTQRE